MLFLHLRSINLCVWSALNKWVLVCEEALKDVSEHELQMVFTFCVYSSLHMFIYACDMLNGKREKDSKKQKQRENPNDSWRWGREMPCWLKQSLKRMFSVTSHIHFTHPRHRRIRANRSHSIEHLWAHWWFRIQLRFKCDFWRKKGQTFTF